MSLPIRSLFASLALLGGCRVWLTADDLRDGTLGSCVDGHHSIAARYEACVPDDWNGDLVVWAHGYQSRWHEPEPLVHDDELAKGLPVSEVAMGLGYGWATTSYSSSGFAAAEAVDDLEDVVRVFEEAFGRAGRVYVAGGSEGGLAGTLALERPGTPFDGGLLACAPSGSLRKQFDYVGDVRVLFDHLFPGVLPGDALDVPPELLAAWDTHYADAVRAALRADREAFRDLVKAAGVPSHALSEQAVIEAVVGVLWYHVFGTGDLVERLGGSPYDNIGRTYAGTRDDLALNRAVARHAADPEALERLAALETTGALQREAVQIHSRADAIVPYWHLAGYRAKVVEADRADLHARQTSPLYGHCSFAVPEVLAAFGRLVWEVEGVELVIPEGFPGR